jgi:hypothetical protein
MKPDGSRIVLPSRSFSGSVPSRVPSLNQSAETYRVPDVVVPRNTMPAPTGVRPSGKGRPLAKKSPLASSVTYSTRARSSGGNAEGSGTSSSEASHSKKRSSSPVADTTPTTGFAIEPPRRRNAPKALVIGDIGDERHLGREGQVAVVGVQFASARAPAIRREEQLVAGGDQARWIAEGVARLPADEGHLDRLRGRLPIGVHDDQHALVAVGRETGQELGCDGESQLVAEADQRVGAEIAEGGGARPPRMGAGGGPVGLPDLRPQRFRRRAARLPQEQRLRRGGGRVPHHVPKTRRVGRREAAQLRQRRRLVAVGDRDGHVHPAIGQGDALRDEHPVGGCDGGRAAHDRSPMQGVASPGLPRMPHWQRQRPGRQTPAWNHAERDGAERT